MFESDPICRSRLAMPKRVDQLLQEAARVEIMPRFRNLAAHEVRQKSSAMDLVTDADEAAERLIAKGLRQIFPHAVVIGEEATERDPTLLNALADADLAFLIDPVDGTKNFASGLPLFGVMVAAVRRGEVVAGWIHDPDWKRYGDGRSRRGGLDRTGQRQPDRSSGRDPGFRCGDVRVRLLASFAPAYEVHGRGEPRGFRGCRMLPLRGARVPYGGRRALPLPCRLEADAVGSRGWLAAPSGSRRLLRTF